MRGALTGALFLLPSVDRFLSRLVDDLSNRRSVLLLVPHGIETIEVWSRLESRLWRQDFDLRSVSLTELSTAATPAALLGDALGIEWPSPDVPRTAESLGLAGGLPEVLHLSGLAQLAATRRQEWLSWLALWARVSQNAADRGAAAMALLVLAPATAVLSLLPESGPRLAVHWWWGFPSALETRLLCRLGCEDAELDTRALWREHVLPAVAGGNARLTEHLWDDLYQGTHHLLERLLLFAETQGWDRERLQRMGAQGLVSFPDAARLRSSSPPPRWRELWACGVLGWTPEHGLELDTAALAGLGRTDEVMHRLWRGQANLVLPLIDQIRLGLCDHLTHRYGPGWPLRWARPASIQEEEEVGQSPLACGWGYLEWLLSACHQLRAERRWLSLSSAARWVRNELAHYRPLTFADFENLWCEIARTAPAAPGCA